MWPNQRTAILVIHGIGQQSPFDTLDAFVQTLLAVLKEQNQDQNVEAWHHLMPREGWIESYISIVKNGDMARNIDVFEYYWAHNTERQISDKEVFQWLIVTAEAARKFYDDNPQLTHEYEAFGSEIISRKRRFRKYWYLKHISFTFKVGWLLLSLGFPGFFVENVIFFHRSPLFTDVIRPIFSPPVVGAAAGATIGIGSGIGEIIALTVIGTVAGAIFSAIVRNPEDRIRLSQYWIERVIFRRIEQFVKSATEGYIGDIAIYTTTDIKSKHYQVRQKILEHAVGKVESLLKSKAPEYGKMILVGHSLGSVIAYDVLNRVNHRMNVGWIDPTLAQKMAGLVTFGSPLDKVAFFFRERSKSDQVVKRHMLKHYHSFRAKDWDPIPQNGVLVQNGIKSYLDRVPWLNFWDPKDPIAGRLDSYRLDRGDNTQCNQGAKWGAAHTRYWNYKFMYEKIVRRLF